MATAVRRRNGYPSYNSAPYEAYDGSAARQLGGAEVLQPRPLVRPRERAIARPRVQVRESGKVSIFAVVGFLAIGVFAVLLLMSCVRLATISEGVVSLRSEMVTLKGEEAKLRAQYELAYDLSTVELNATIQQGMAKPQSGQMFYVDLSAPDAVTLFQKQEAATGVAGAAESIKEIGSEIVEYFR